MFFVGLATHTSLNGRQNIHVPGPERSDQAELHCVFVQV